MREKKRFLLEYKREIISAIAAGIILVSVSGCAKQEETNINSEEAKSGYLIVQSYPYVIDGEINSVYENYDFVEDKSLGEVIIVTREYYNNNIKYKK